MVSKNKRAKIMYWREDLTGKQNALKWFAGCQNADEIRKRYYSLAMKYHPDRPENSTKQAECTANMQEINSGFDYAGKNNFAGTQQNYKTKENFTYTEDQQKGKWQEMWQYKEHIDKIIRFPDIKIEICGIYIWVTGLYTKEDTKKYSKHFKEAGFSFCFKKIDEFNTVKVPAWFWKPENYVPKGRRMDLNQIRNTFGSEVVETKENKGLDEL